MKPLLLVLEDVDAMREWLKILLLGYFPKWQIQAVGTAVDFRRALERERPALILMDEVLGPGEDLASLLQSVNRLEIPVSFMTGMDPTHPRSQRLPEGVMRRIIKPEWESGVGTEVFLSEVTEVMTLTLAGRIG